MPTVRIEMFPGRTPEQKRALIEEVTNAVIAALGVRQAGVRVSITEIERSHFAVGGVLASEGTSG